jgi:TrmH family RNA methyltransferase
MSQSLAKLPADPSAVITSRSNPLIREVRALAQKKVRQARGEFLMEGIQGVLQAIASRAPIRLLLVAPELLTSKPARLAVRDAGRAGTRVVNVSPNVLKSLAERENPTGLAAVIQIQTVTLDRLRADASSIFIALDRVSNPGNLGAILRSADAVQARGVLLIGDVTDPFAPNALNASRGAVFTVPLVRVANMRDALNWGREQGLKIVTSSDRAAQTLWEADLTAPLMLVLGNEGEGLDPVVLEQGQAVRIPMRGQVDSLNLAVAAGVLLYESARQTGEVKVAASNHNKAILTGETLARDPTADHS